MEKNKFSHIIPALGKLTTTKENNKLNKRNQKPETQLQILKQKKTLINNNNTY